ncbi:MAG: hypothetical protein ABH950_09210 [Candidatus Altiarchaeota archaeon]
MKVTLFKGLQKPSKKDYEQATQIDWSHIGLNKASLEEKAQFTKWVRTATESAPTLIDFVEETLRKTQRGTFQGNIVFLGRNADPFYVIASILAPSYTVPLERLKRIELPSDIVANQSDQEIFRYLKENEALQGNAVTLVDDGGLGGTMKKLKNIIREESEGTIHPKSFQLASLSPRHRTMLTQRPWKWRKIFRALLFTTSQPHDRTRAEKLSLDANGKTISVATETSNLERLGVGEINQILKEKTSERIRRRKIKMRKNI